MMGRGRFLGNLHMQMMHDRFITAILTVLLTISSILVLLAGIAVWPVVCGLMNGNGILSEVCGTIYRTNLVVFIIYIAISGVFAFFEHGFSFIKTTLINVCIGIIVNFVMLMSQQRVIQEATELSAFMATLLWFVVSFLAAGILTVLPALITGGIAKMIHTLFFKLYDWKHGG